MVDMDVDAHHGAVISAKTRTFIFSPPDSIKFNLFTNKCTYLFHKHDCTEGGGGEGVQSQILKQNRSKYFF